ncbi:MAG: glycosyltransferase [Vicingaceae bacterium]
MTKVDLHIIAFDVPYPADYGGVIDVFCKIKSLHRLGMKLALHLFEYGRGEQEALEKYAQEVNYYPRKNSLVKQFSALPFIVNSRQSEKMLQRLKQDEVPILFEGLHACYYLDHPDLKDRQKMVRSHNVEHHYYGALAAATKGWRKRYFQWEAHRLEQFERRLSHADHLLAISKSDQQYFQQYKTDVRLLPPFHPYVVENPSEAVEDFALYHGNLSVAENQKAVDFLIEVFYNTDFQLIVAGKNPDKGLRDKLKRVSNIQLIENPTESELKQLIRSAKINCLPTFQTTGVKLKLIRALIQGNEVLVNSAMLEGTDLKNHCKLAANQVDWREKLKALFQKDFDPSEVFKRQNAVAALFNNQDSARILRELCVPAR